MDRNAKRTLWIVAGAVVVVALIRSHHISTNSVLLFVAIIPSIILHEVSHGWVARAFGDDTAARAGRLTLNPLVHVDPVGTLILPALLSLGGFGVFGWAKPVPVNPARLRSPRNQGVLVSLAGPFTNAILVAIAAVVFIAFLRTPFNETLTPTLLSRFVVFFSLGNLGLFVFNMLPIPPLDGSVLFERALPARYWPNYLRIRQYTMPIVLGLVLLNFYLGAHGPLTWAFDHVYNWWLGVMGVQTLRFA